MENGDKKGLFHKDNVQYIYMVAGITASLLSAGFFIFDKLTTQGEKNKEIVVRIERDVEGVKKNVDVVNQKLDTLLVRRNPNVKYVEQIDYSQSGGVLKKNKSTVVSNVPINEVKESQVIVMDKLDSPLDESAFVVSNDYIKKEKAKKNVNQKLKFVPAVFYGDQVVGNNSTVYFRFPESVEVEGKVFERNTQFYAEAKKVSDMKYKFDVSEISGNSISAVIYDVNKVEGLNTRDVFKDGQKIFLVFE